MKTLPFIEPLVQRWREESSGVVVRVDERRPFRLWMTGSLAVVMAAMFPMRGATEAERQQAMRLLRHSRFDVSETLARIERAAADRGLSVLARWSGPSSTLVLASSVGGTLVVMENADSAPMVPFGLVVRPAGRGEADVLVAPPPAPSAMVGLRGGPLARVADDLSGLPSLVEHALA
jgi:hypothetical protein